MQRAYISLDRDSPHPVRSGTTGEIAPTITGSLETLLDIGFAYFRNNTQEAIAAGTTGGKLTLKEAGSPGGNALGLDTVWDVEGSGAASIYRFKIVLNSSALFTAIGDQDSITLKACVEWLLDGAPAVSKTVDFDIVVLNSSSRSGDEAPEANAAASELWIDDRAIRYLPLVVGLTGGGATKLDGRATVDNDAGEAVCLFDDAASSALRVYELAAGTDAESSPDVIRPDDYNASTNAKVWKLRNTATTEQLAWLTAQGERLLRSVSGLTGGGSTNLDGAVEPTTDDVGAIYTLYIVGAASPYQKWRVFAGTDAEDAANGIVRPDNFHATTNAVVLKQII